MERRTFIKNAGIAGGMALMSPLMANVKNSGEHDFQLVDLHVHLINEFTIDKVMHISKERKIKSGSGEDDAV